MVPGASDPLHPARHRRRRFNLNHQIDCTHIDPKLERRGCHQRFDLSLLQQLLDLRPLHCGKRAVMGTRNRLSRKLIQRAQRAAPPLGAR